MIVMVLVLRYHLYLCVSRLTGGVLHNQNKLYSCVSSIAIPVTQQTVLLCWIFRERLLTLYTVLMDTRGLGSVPSGRVQL